MTSVRLWSTRRFLRKETELSETNESRVERLYKFVLREEGEDRARDLPEGAAQWVPRNFFALLLSFAATKLGDALSNPKTVLAWVMDAVGAPVGFLAMLVPIRESGSMIPQLFLGHWVREQRFRKPLWNLGVSVEAAAIFGCGAAALWLEGALAGAVLLAMVILFSLGRSLRSLTSKDITGKTIPKGTRGRLGGWASSISGALTLAVGLWFAVRERDQDSPVFYAGLLGGAALLFVLGATFFSFIRERPSTVSADREGSKPTAQSSWSRLGLLRTDRDFGRFVLTRSLLLCSALSAPFYVKLARDQSVPTASLLGTFLVAGGLATTVASPFWGAMADRSSRNVMAMAAFLTATLGTLAFVLIRWQPEWVAASWIFPAFFFGLGIAHAGVRVGRKTYVVDLAKGQKRTDYVSVSNTVIGFVLLAVGAVSSLLSSRPPEEVILMLSFLGFAGTLMATSLPETK